MVFLMGFVQGKRFRRDKIERCDGTLREGALEWATNNDGLGDAVSGGCCERWAVTRAGDTDE